MLVVLKLRLFSDIIMSNVESENEEVDVTNDKVVADDNVIKTYGKKKQAAKKIKNKLVYEFFISCIYLKIKLFTHFIFHNKFQNKFVVLSCQELAHMWHFVQVVCNGKYTDILNFIYFVWFLGTLRHIVECNAYI